MSLIFTFASIRVDNVDVSVLRKYGLSIVALSVYFILASILVDKVDVSVLRRYFERAVAVSDAPIKVVVAFGYV